MARVTKTREEARNDLLDTAEELFVENGFEKTTVSDIVRRLGVAQGTFYYYFKSKDDLVDALLDRCSLQIADLAEQVSNENGLNAREKIQKMFFSFLTFDGWNREIFEYIHQDENLILHHLLEERTTLYVTPIVCKVIHEGLKTGLFDTRFPDFAALMVVTGIGNLFDTLRNLDTSNKEYTTQLQALEEYLNRVLGVKHESFSLIKMDNGGKNHEQL